MVGAGGDHGAVQDQRLGLLGSVEAGASQHIGDKRARVGLLAIEVCVMNLDRHLRELEQICHAEDGVRTLERNRQGF